MTPDLARLRQLAEECRAANTWKVGADGIKTIDIDAAHDASHAFSVAVDPATVLALIDRLELAEGRLATARAHWRITAGSTYAMSGMGRILGEEGER